jgi:hypothetical protein
LAKVARDHGTGYAGQRIFVVRREDYVGRPRRSTSVRSPTMKRDTDEKELLESVERGEWKSASGGFSEVAEATCRTAAGGVDRRTVAPIRCHTAAGSGR